MQCAAAVDIASAASSYTWDMVPIVPNCKGKIQCEREDIPTATIQAGIVARLQDMIERAVKSGGQISIASMSFTDESLFGSVCEAGRKGLSIEAYFHSTAAGDKGFGTRLMRDCQGQSGKNVTVYFMGMPKNGKTGWRLHHNKYFMVDFGGMNDVEIAFGSANLSKQGLSVNFENWNFVRASRESTFVADYLCNVKAMRVARLAGKMEDDPVVFRQELVGCLAGGGLTAQTVDAVLKRDSVANFFAPDRENHIYSVLANQITRVVAGGRIRMAAYFFMHKPLIDLLVRAVQRGVTVELLVDDDIYEGGSIAKQKKIWTADLQPLKSGFIVRSFDTAEESHQLQHNKFLVLEGVDRPGTVRVFGGAGQFTESAFQNNYENFFLVSDPDVVRAYNDLFTKLWAMAMSIK